MREMLFSDPETSQFLAAVERLKRLIRRKQRLTRQARQRLKSTLRKLQAN
jgi:hypothetical protein